MRLWTRTDSDIHIPTDAEERAKSSFLLNWFRLYSILGESIKGDGETVISGVTFEDRGP